MLINKPLPGIFMAISRSYFSHVVYLRFYSELIPGPAEWQHMSWPVKRAMSGIALNVITYAFGVPMGYQGNLLSVSSRREWSHLALAQFLSSINYRGPRNWLYIFATTTALALSSLTSLWLPLTRLLGGTCERGDYKSGDRWLLQRVILVLHEDMRCVPLGGSESANIGLHGMGK